MKLEEMLKGVDVISIIGEPDTDIKGIAYDSRDIKKEDLFFCISGYKTDGHKFAYDAFNNGAAAFIVENEIQDEIYKKALVIKVADSRKALSRISANYFKHPSKRLNVFGVTGTNGKTTITYLIKQILEAANISCGLLGTISYKIGNNEYNSSNTTPESFELQKMFDNMHREKINACAMEVSSHSLALSRVEDIDFDYGIFTNLTPDHLDFHEDFDHYYLSKKKLFYKTRKANIINEDDKYGKKLAYELKNELNVPCFTFGVQNDADYKAENISISEKSSSFELLFNRKILGFLSLPIPGMFSVYNALAAAGICLEAGIGFEEVKAGLQNIKGVPGRFQVVENKKDIIAIVDYAHTPDALEKVLSTANGFKKGRLICLFGCGGDRDRTKRPLMGKIAGELADYCIITSDNPRNEDPKQILKDTETGIIPTECPYEIVEDRFEAIKRTVEIYNKNDIIILAGKGHETYQVIGSHTIHFDDREAVLSIIESM